MNAEVYSLKSLEGKRLPTIVLCHGWGGVARDLRPEGIAFARAGYLAVAIDYRGWGQSDARLILTGPSPSDKPNRRFTAEVQEVREVVDPIDQTTDLQNAIHWVAGDPQCDPAHIGLWGSSYSGGHVVYAAARDQRVKATVSQVPALDSRWVVSNPILSAPNLPGSDPPGARRGGIPRARSADHPGPARRTYPRTNDKLCTR